MTNVISTSELTKYYDTGCALSGIDLDVKDGEIFSIIGPDGAGKSTFIRILCGILKPTAGSLNILGMEWQKNRKEIKNQIGYLSQRFNLYGDLTVEENIDFFAAIHRQKKDETRKAELLEFTRLTPFNERLAEHLSGGMKQKLALVCTLIHNPKLIFLDEPTVGVDPVSRIEFWNILSSLKKTGITIFMATPYLDEAERCSRVALIDKGKILVCDEPQNIRQINKKKMFEVICTTPRKAYNLLKEKNIPCNVQLFGDRLHISPENEDNGIESVSNFLFSGGISIFSSRQITPSIEDIFISLIEK